MIFLLPLLSSLSLTHGGPTHHAIHWERPSRHTRILNGVRLTSIDYTYTIDGAEYEGYVSAPSTPDDHNVTAAPLSLPGVLVAHQWMGLGEMEKFRADQMASFGYVAFALDMYGKGIRPTTSAEAKGNSSALTSDPAELHKRALAALDVLRELSTLVPGTPAVNGSALVAQGYCFGGLVALELARIGGGGDAPDTRLVASTVSKAPSKLPLVAVASFHGELGALEPIAPGAIVTSVQVHHADLDSQGSQGLLAFEDEMRTAKVANWATSKYGNCAHGWTDPTSSKYEEQAAVQSHASMRHFFAYALGFNHCHPTSY